MHGTHTRSLLYPCMNQALGQQEIAYCLLHIDPLVKRKKPCHINDDTISNRVRFFPFRKVQTRGIQEIQGTKNVLCDNKEQHIISRQKRNMLAVLHKLAKLDNGVGL